MRKGIKMAWNWNWLTRKIAPAADPALPRLDDKGREISPETTPKKHNVTWALNNDEANFNPRANVVSFRTLGFRNLAHPDSPIEYLEADYDPETKRWRLCQCSVGSGRALSVLFNREATASTVAVPTYKSTTLADNAAFMVVLQKMAVYEFGTDTASQYAMREVIEEDIANSYFMNIAHSAGVIFDVNGHPSMTRNGRPLRDGQYPQSELDHAATYDNEHKPVSLPALLGAALLGPESAGLDSFDEFSSLISFNQNMNDVICALENGRQNYFTANYNNEKNIYEYSEAEWPALTPYFINGCFGYLVKKTEEISAVLSSDENHQNVVDSLKDISVMLCVIQAVTTMQFYHNNNGAGEANHVDANAMETALASANTAMSSCESFSKERQRMIRGFIMGHHSVKDVLAMYDSVVANTRSIAEASQRAEKAAIEKSKVKIEVTQADYQIPVQEGTVSLGFIEEKYPSPKTTENASAISINKSPQP